MIRLLLVLAALIPLCFQPLSVVVPGANAETSAMPQPWGTWVWLTHTPSGAALPALVTLHQDGTVAVSDTTMFGGLPGSTMLSTPLSGVWERTGPHAIGGTSLYLVFDSATSLLAGFGRARTALEFPVGMADQFQGIMFVDFLACPTPFTCPDPQNTSAAWMAFNPAVPSFAVSAKRLRRVEVGPLQP
jgi:hypothetical protein